MIKFLRELFYMVALTLIFITIASGREFTFPKGFKKVLEPPRPLSKQ